MDIIVKLFDLYHDKSNCKWLCMLLLANAGFCRYKELSYIGMIDISFYNAHVEIISIHNSKTDIYWQRSIVIEASTDMPT